MNRVVVQKYLNNKIKIMIYNETICKRQTKTKSKTNRNQSEGLRDQLDVWE